MIYPTNDQMPEQVPTAPLQPSSRWARAWGWVRLRFRLALRVEQDLQVLMQVLHEQNVANRALLERIVQLESNQEAAQQLLVNQGKIVQLHHETLKRWALESATLRDIEERHFKKLRREAQVAGSITPAEGSGGAQEAQS